MIKPRAQEACAAGRHSTADDSDGRAGREHRHTMGETPATQCEYVFGPFRLIPARQLLLDGGTPVRLGSRALDILTALVERQGEVVRKTELLARAWPNTCVEENNLKVHVAALRRVLGGGNRYIVTANGRGYRFAAPVQRVGLCDGPQPAPRGRTGLLIGRDGTLRRLLATGERLRTLVGPGGIGKTTLARAVVDQVAGHYADGVCVAELAPLHDPQLVPGTLAHALGLTPHSDNALEAVIAHLHARRMLIVLDCCEHVVEAAARVTEALLIAAPGVSVLATSREPLRARDEVVLRIEPLEIPARSDDLRGDGALAFPAVALFVERAQAIRADFELTDANAAQVAEICRRLDGIPLAIELAARRTDAFDVGTLLSLLDDRLGVLTQGRRTDLPRHQTMEAAIDWSFALLAEDERTMLRRLSIFTGSFTLASAAAVAGDPAVSAVGSADRLGSLVAKSLICADTNHPTALYRLLDTTRAYARGRLGDSGEAAAIARRHALHVLERLSQAEGEWEVMATAQWLAAYAPLLDDLRAALDWAVSDAGSHGLAVALSAAALPLWTQMSLLAESRTRIERLLASSVDLESAGGREEMKLAVALGGALLQTRGPTPAAARAWSAAGRIAGELGDVRYRLRSLWGLCDHHTWLGEHQAALHLVGTMRSLAAEHGDRAAQINLGRQAGTSLRYLGELAAARSELEGMIERYEEPRVFAHSSRFQQDPRAAARGTLANVLWLQGLPREAQAMADRSLADARAGGHAVALCNALGHTAIPIALYVGDRSRAAGLLDELESYVARNAMPIWSAIARCLRGMLLLHEGHPLGICLMQEGLGELGRSRFGMRCPGYLGALASGLAAHGRLAEARGAIEEALAWALRTQELWCLDELQRIKAAITGLEGDRETAEQLLVTSMESAAARGARAWQQRACASLAQLRSDRRPVRASAPPQVRGDAGTGSQAQGLLPAILA